MPAGQVELWVRALSRVIGDHFLALSSQGRRGLAGRLVLFLSSTGPNPTMGALPSCPNPAPKTLPPHTITLGLGFQHMNPRLGSKADSPFPISAEPPFFPSGTEMENRQREGRTGLPDYVSSVLGVER